MEGHRFTSMATYTVARTARRFIFLFALFLFIILTCYLLPTKMMPTTSNSQLKRQIYIGGRWKSVRESLGLPPLPDVVSFPSNSNFIIVTPSESLSRSSRFDLKRKRSIELASQISSSPLLYLAADALEEQSIPLARMAASFRAIALAEKGIALEQARARLLRQGQSQRSPRRPSSWGTRIAKMSLGE